MSAGAPRRRLARRRCRNGLDKNIPGTYNLRFSPKPYWWNASHMPDILADTPDASCSVLHSQGRMQESQPLGSDRSGPRALPRARRPLRHSLLGGVPQGSSRARVISAMLISPAYRPWRRAIAGYRRGAVLRLRRPGQHSNTAKRMETYGLPGRVHISATIRQALGEAFYFEPRVRSRSKAKGRWRPISSIAEKKRPAPREGCRPRS